jgi:hypothetical protein
LDKRGNHKSIKNPLLLSFHLYSLPSLIETLEHWITIGKQSQQCWLLKRICQEL